MTAQARIRIAAAVGALVAPMALVAVSAASSDAAPNPKHKHEMVLYKVESTVKLGGGGSEIDSPNQSLSCNPGDYVLDGMWLVKHVDQYAPDPDEDPDFPTGGAYNDERDVWVQASHADAGDYRTWDFVFDNKAYGDAQLRLAITCINGYTQNTNGHNHAITVTALTPQAGTPITSSDLFDGRFQVDTPSACTAGRQFLVAPGFDLSSSSYRLVGSFPTASGLSWRWQFADTPAFPAPLPDVTVFARCINRQTAVGAGHQHQIAMKHVPDFFGHQSWIAKSYPQEVQYQCDQDFTIMHNYKAMVGWFYMGFNWQHNWFIGMEPRPKLRAYTFFNQDPASNPAEVYYGTLCINARTSNPV